MSDTTVHPAAITDPATSPASAAPAAPSSAAIAAAGAPAGPGSAQPGAIPSGSAASGTGQSASSASVASGSVSSGSGTGQSASSASVASGSVSSGSGRSGVASSDSGLAGLAPSGAGPTRPASSGSGPAAAAPAPRRKRRQGGTVARRVVIGLALAGTLIPQLYLVSVSLMNRGEVGAGVLFPTNPRWENWVAAWTESTLPSALVNSIVVALGGALLTLVFALPGAWAIVRFRAGGRALSASILAPWLLPPIVAVVPLFTLLRVLGLNNTVAGLIIVYGLANTAIAIWLLQGFVQKLPIELEEAAALDGAGTLRTLVSVVTPLLAPGLIAVGIVVAVLNYNEFLFALFLTQGPQSQTVPVALSLLLAERVQDFGKIAAAALIGVIPVFAAAVFLQRGLVSGLTAGAIK